MSFCRSYSYSKRLDQLSKNEVYYNNLKHRQVICNNYENFLNNDPEIDGEKRRDYIYKVDFKNLNTVFFGGGTPSLMPLEIIESILDVSRNI